MNSEDILSKFQLKPIRVNKFEGDDGDLISNSLILTPSSQYLELLVNKFTSDKNFGQSVLKWLKEEFRHPKNRSSAIERLKDEFDAALQSIVCKAVIKLSENFDDSVQKNLHNLPTQSPPKIFTSIDVTELSESDRFHKEFTEREKIGKGGYGAVYKACHRLDKKSYAIKCIPLNSNYHNSAAQALREVKQLASLQHPNIVRYHTAWLECDAVKPPNYSRQLSIPSNSSDSDEENISESLVIEFNSSKNSLDDKEKNQLEPYYSPHQSINFIFRVKLCIQMELCETTLERWLQKRNELNNFSIVNGEKEINIIRQVLLALSYIHEKGIMHRDVNPKNIFLKDISNDILVQLGDFGLARELSDEDCDCTMSSFTTSGYTDGVGTKSYAAPEQFARREYDNKVDMYSVGLILIELFYVIKTGMERDYIFREAKREEVSLPNELYTNFPVIARYVKKLLNLDPKARPTADQILSCEYFSKTTININNLMETIDNQQKLIDQLRSQLLNVKSNCKCGISFNI
ncbi:DgyrCDS6497 [Dimorphilus gyrociliatus]|uniref:DgyrCDS6497 n=1 Tax=Dimorphilus gyrociliatus TaxID=2664684 RepID=A0A7I8VND6_9ANNE|nr:DgyrCDS6497 [Dimorphilus gyrociliatus]